MMGQEDVAPSSDAEEFVSVSPRACSLQRHKLVYNRTVTYTRDTII